MPATVAHIQLNLNKIQAGKDDELKRLIKAAEEQTEIEFTTRLADGQYEPKTIKGKLETPEQAELRRDTDKTQFLWAVFVMACDRKKVADRIPSSVGKRYARKYGTQAERPKRGQLNEFPLHAHILSALEANAELGGACTWNLGEYRGAPLFMNVVDGTFSFRNRRNAVYALEELQRRVQRNIVTSVPDGAKQRNAISALLRKVDI